MPTARELTDDDLPLAAAALRALRPDVPDVVAAVRAQRADGYRLAASFADGDEQAAAVAGFRLGTNLAWGRHCYVDDLSTRPEHRGAGHADAVMRLVEEIARAAGCEQLHLDSGVDPDSRSDAHRFYFNHRLRIDSHHFSKRL